VPTVEVEKLWRKEEKIVQKRWRQSESRVAIQSHESAAPKWRIDIAPNLRNTEQIESPEGKTSDGKPQMKRAPEMLSGAP
jgi:hypothetical protein